MERVGSLGPGILRRLFDPGGKALVFDPGGSEYVGGESEILIFEFLLWDWGSTFELKFEI